MADVRQDVSELYVGLLGRPGDPDGATFWNSFIDDELAAGRGIDAIEQEVAARFADSAEAKDLYGFLADPASGDVNQFIDDVYQNLFNRAPDDAGRQFWQDRLEALVADGVGAEKGASRFILEVLNAAQNEDAATVQNKADIATLYSQRFIDTNATFDSAQDLEGAKNLVDGVGAGDASVSTARGQLVNILQANTPDPAQAHIVGGESFDTVQAAVDAAQDGDTIALDAGTLSGFTIASEDAENLTIRGLGATVERGGNAPQVITTANSDVTLRDFTVAADGANRGLRLANLDEAERTLTLDSLDVSGFDVAAVTATGIGLNLEAINNTVTGDGLRTGDTPAQNGIEVRDGAGANIGGDASGDGNTFSEIGSDGGVSSAYVFIDQAGDGVSVSNNTITGLNTDGTLNTAVGVSVNNTDGLSVTENAIDGVLEGVRLGAEAGGTPTVNGNTFSDQVVSVDTPSGPVFGFNVNARGGQQGVATDGADNLVGTDGDDTFDAGGGDDVLSGNVGVDSLTGGPGEDTFIIRQVDASPATAPDTIQDFDDGADILAFAGLVPDGSATDRVLAKASGPDEASVANYFDDGGEDVALAFFDDGTDGHILLDANGDGDFGESEDVEVVLAGVTETPGIDAFFV